MVKPNPMQCKICRVKVVRPLHASWEDHGVCPKCFDMKPADFIPAYNESPQLVKQVTPLDRYLHIYTNKALGREESMEWVYK